MAEELLLKDKCRAHLRTSALFQAKTLQLQEVKVPQALLRLLCSWPILSQLYMHSLQQHGRVWVRFSACC